MQIRDSCVLLNIYERIVHFRLFFVIPDNDIRFLL